MYYKASILLLLSLLFSSQLYAQQSGKPRVIISTDIGGTDPDDFQSMIHLLMYSDQMDIEGLISSAYGNGRTSDIFRIIDLYEKDYAQLFKHNSKLENPKKLREITKQGALGIAPFKGYSTPSEGSEWIIKRAKKQDSRPLWILVWGGLEDVAQALKDAPEIQDKIRVYWIGGPNKKWSVNAYNYIAENHGDLWFIEANATYQGWFKEEKHAHPYLSSKNFYPYFIQGNGHMAADFQNHYQGDIKMGDTPSVAYLLNGEANNPQEGGWGGQFVPIKRSSKRVFHRNTALRDTVPVYSVVEWVFQGPEISIAQDSSCFEMETLGQVWPGYYIGGGQYSIRYSPKKVGDLTYIISSSIEELDKQKGELSISNPWPGKEDSKDFLLGNNWYSDVPDKEHFIDGQQGTQTIAKHREAYLKDWAERWSWLKDSTQKTPVQVKKDNSFTLESTFEKERKYRDYITIAEVQSTAKEHLNIPYDSIGNRPLLLDVFIPRSKKQKAKPGVLLIHGGGWQSGDKSQMHTIAKALSNAGYVAVCVEYRLSDEAKYPEAVYDLKAALRWMRAHAKSIELDPDFIVSLGTSAGGQLASLLGVTNNNPSFEEPRRSNLEFSSSVQAVVNIDGTLAFRHPESSEGTAAANWLKGTYEESSKNWEDAAPLNHVSAEAAPVLFLNSSIPRFHAGRDDMIKKLNKYDIAWEVKEFPDTPHTYWFFNPWFKPMMENTTKFLEKIYKP